MTLPRTMLVAAALAAAPLLPALPAQVRPRLVGLVDSTPAAVVGQDPVSCGTRSCNTLLAPPAAPAAGGTAFDAVRSAVWVSNGPVVAAVDADSCREACAPHRLPDLSLGTLVTGLAIDESRQWLLAADTGDSITRYRLECPVRTRVGTCRVTLPRDHRIGGLAVDDVAGLVFWVASSFDPATPSQNLLFVARIEDPCSPVCRPQPIRACSGALLGPIRGLAHDSCRDVLWATDGNVTVALRRDSVACSFTQVSCCRRPGPPLVGLGLRPEPPSPSGRSCTNLGCPSCPSLLHSATGDPVVGNRQFTLDLQGAPANARVALFFNVGPCSPPGFAVPPFCGPLLVPISPLPVTVSAATGGTLGCTGRVGIAVPVPPEPSLCGATLSSQFAGVCTVARIGTFVSNCLTFTVQGT